MKLNKILLTAGFITMCGSLVFAQDFGDFGDFGDSSDSFGGDDSFGGGSASSKVELSGNVETEIRAYTDADAPEKIEMGVTPAANLNLKYAGNKSDVELNLKVDENTIKKHPADVIDEAVLRGYFNTLTLEAGKMKVVWGKGDKLHVFDNFNSDDYSDFIIPDYLDRRVSTPMIRGIVSLPVANLNIEGIYTPLLPTDLFATDGRWTPAQVTGLTQGVTAIAKESVSASVRRLEKARMEATTAKNLQAAGNTAQLSSLVQQAIADGKISNYTTQEIIAYCTAHSMDPTNSANQVAAATAILSQRYSNYIEKELTDANTAYTLALTNASSLSSDSSVIYPDMKTLKYGQFGGRATWTLGQVDMGVSYYNGWYKQPSVNGDKLNAFVAKWLANGTVTEEDKFLSYDKKQTFGVEASSVLWHFNIRGEFAYNLTEDTGGTNPWVHNNSIGWLGGFDIDLPFANANLNVQEIGTYVLHGGNCNKNKADVDYGANGYTNNKIAANLTTSFMNDKIAPEVTVMYGIENKDLVVMPKLSYKADQNLSFTASGMIIQCYDDNSEFKSWKKNSFVSLSAKYQF